MKKHHLYKCEIKGKIYYPHIRTNGVIEIMKIDTTNQFQLSDLIFELSKEQKKSIIIFCSAEDKTEMQYEMNYFITHFCKVCTNTEVHVDSNL